MKYRVMSAATLVTLLAGTAFAAAEEHAVNLVAAGVQNAASHAPITNWGSADLHSGIQGDGSSVTISAIGAVAANSITNVDAGSRVNAIGVFHQTAKNSSYGAVQNTGTIDLRSWSGGIHGNGSSATVSATGAAAANSITNVTSGGVGNIIAAGSQDASNSHARISNTGTIYLGAGLKGTGSSATISATGAAAANSITNVESGARVNAIGVFSQSAYNSGEVINSGAIAAGKINGNDNSAAVSATGAVAANSITNVDVFSKTSVIGAGKQTATNIASITNTGTIKTTSLTGNASSITISALGAGTVNSITNVGKR